MLHRRYYRIGGLTVQVESELPITDSTFQAKFRLFEVDGPGENAIVIRHRFTPFDFENEDLGERVHRQAPWAIYRRGDEWLYLSVSPTMKDTEALDVAVLSDDHTRGIMYHAREDIFRRGDLHSLFMFNTDQVILARVLAQRQGCYFHASGAIMDGQGLLFAGHSEAGKSTMVEILRGQAEILCDDRIIVRHWPAGAHPGAGGFYIHGTWSHGDVPDVSPNSAPLRAILFLEQAPENRLIPLSGGRAIVSRLLACLVTPYPSADWWEMSLDLVERIARDVPCYRLRFDKSRAVVDVLKHELAEEKK